MRGARSDEIAARVMMAKNKWGSELELVDGTGGFGSGVIDSLIIAGHTPIEVQFAGKANDPRYYNKRSEIWFLMAEWIRRGGSIPNIPELITELTAPTYTLNKGKFFLEPKDQIKDRIGVSPDYADALAITFAIPDMKSNFMHGIPIRENNGGLESDYDPFDTSRLWPEHN